MSQHEEEEDETNMLDAEEAAEIVPDEDADLPMESDEEREDHDSEDDHIQLQNDSIGHFDGHTDSIFCVAQHPLRPEIVATGGGDDQVMVWNASPGPKTDAAARDSQTLLSKLDGHTDSVNALAFTLPKGGFLLSGGLDGQLRVYNADDFKFLASVQEVPEINFIAPYPGSHLCDAFALGASDGSVWVYSIEDKTPQLIQAYFLHGASCTAGCWTPDGKLLATVSEDGSLYVWDVLGEAAGSGNTQTVVALTQEDQRFAVEGGLYSVAVAPNGAFVVVGGANGMIRVVGLPKTTIKGQRVKGGSSDAAGQILSSLQVQSDGIETLSFSDLPLTLLAAGSVDGSIVLLDHAHRFAVRRHIKEAHEDYAVVKVEFCTASVNAQASHILTSCGMDGVIRQWDARGGTAAGGQGLLAELKGHRGEGEGGGIMGFVQNPSRIVTAGDDGVALVFEGTK